MEGVDAAPRQELDDLSFHRGDISAAVLEPEPVGRVGEARAKPVRERRGHEDVGRETVDVVVDDLAREDDETDEPGREPCRRLGRHGLKPVAS